MAGHGRSLRRFGVEEEYLLLDADSGRPTDQAADLIRSVPELGDRAEREFFSSQMETATPVCTEAAEAEQALGRFRSVVSRAASARGVVLAGSGLPPVGGETEGTVTPRLRYRAIESEMRTAGADQYGTGTHVHVEIPSRDAGVDVLARLSRWAPALMAITANSPHWCGEPTGFASWRYVKSLSWPLAGYPPPFIDGDDYAAAVERLVGSGVLLDTGVVTWLARLSEHYPTLELRIADAQLESADAVAFALIVRALVESALEDAREGGERPRMSPGLVNGAVWMAARDGLGAELVDPLTGRAAPAFELIDAMYGSVERELSRAGDLDRVDDYLSRLRRSGGPAKLQRERFARSGVEGLVELYRSGSEAAPAAA